MDRFDCIYTLHSLLTSADTPTPVSKIEEELDCSRTDIEEIVRDMRQHLDAPIEYDRDSNGYFYNKQTNRKYELPGLWFNASELYALLVAHQLLSDVEPGLLDLHITPLKDKIEELLHSKKIRGSEVARRVRILKIASRKPSPKHFSLVVTALLNRYRLYIHYFGREKNQVSERSISPQRLVHYRDNWYLDAYCHAREALRSFALDRIKQTRILTEPAEEIDEHVLQSHYSASYGIFSGRPNNTAILKFNERVAKWVADERWHPQQRGQFDLDGGYTMEIPYSDPRELIMDILKYGASVEVLAPEKLRNAVRSKLFDALEIYEGSNAVNTPVGSEEENN